MQFVSVIIQFVQSHWLDIVSIYTSVVGIASIIVKLTPTLKDDDVLKGIIRFVGKYVALNTSKGVNPKLLIQDLQRLNKLLGLLKTLADVKIETGNLTTPDGTPYRGFKVTVGGSPVEAVRTYDDIEKIFKSNQANFKTYEVRTSQGTFKSYTVET